MLKLNEAFLLSYWIPEKRVAKVNKIFAFSEQALTTSAMVTMSPVVNGLTESHIDVLYTGDA